MPHNRTSWDDCRACRGGLSPGHAKFAARMSTASNAPSTRETQSVPRAHMWCHAVFGNFPDDRNVCVAHSAQTRAVLAFAYTYIVYKGRDLADTYRHARPFMTDRVFLTCAAQVFDRTRYRSSTGSFVRSSETESALRRIAWRIASRYRH